MTQLPTNALVKCFLLLLLMQQGLGSFALAATELFQQASRADVTAVAHACASMNVQAEGHSVSHAGTPESAQHDHQDCVDDGCQHCVGCVACAVGYRNSPGLYVTGRPKADTLAAAIPLPAPERLYRPPILI